MRFYSGVMLSLAVVGSLALCPVNFAKSQPDPHESYKTGVALYREGNYAHALNAFKTATTASPESQEAQYYYAMTLAQLGRFEEARKAYQAVIALAPDSKPAQLAQQGLQYLPDPNNLDAPPRFQETSPTPQSQASANPATPPAQTASQNSSGIDPKTLQMMVMMGSMGGGGGGGFNPMMIPMMAQMTKGTGEQAGGNNAPDSDSITPEVYSSMMMNQMMQNMDFLGKNNKDE